MIRVPEIKLPLDSTEEDLLYYTARHMKIDIKEIQSIQLIKRSIDDETSRIFILYVQWT